jgi:hypothetical protein
MSCVILLQVPVEEVNVPPQVPEVTEKFERVYPVLLQDGPVAEEP